jgi:hypothetical protein
VTRKLLILVLALLVPGGLIALGLAWLGSHSQLVMRLRARLSRRRRRMALDPRLAFFRLAAPEVLDGRQLRLVERKLIAL